MLRTRTLAAAIVFALLSGAECAAQVIEAVPRTPLQSAPRPNLGARAEHAVYGEIVAMNGTLLTVRLRSGRALRVDASEAARRGTYSAPMFLGKLVAAEGSLGAGGVLYAIRVTRLSRIDQTPADR